MESGARGARRAATREKTKLQPAPTVLVTATVATHGGNAGVSPVMAEAKAATQAAGPLQMLPWLAARPVREAARAAVKVDPIQTWKEFHVAKRRCQVARHDCEAALKGGRECDRTRLRNRLAERYLPLVRYTAERVFQKLPQNVELDDLTQAGIFGLMQAIEGFDLARGVKFETYCTTRVRGAILDELRSFDWVPRLVRTKAHKLEACLRKLEVELGRDPTDTEVAGQLGINMDEFDALVKEASAVTVVSLSEKWPQQDEEKTLRKVDFLEDKKETRPIEFVHRKDIVELATRGLTMKERLILLLYYFEDLTMREIGLTLDLSESRVCQLHTRIMERLREQLQRSKGDLLS